MLYFYHLLFFTLLSDRIVAAVHCAPAVCVGLPAVSTGDGTKDARLQQHNTLLLCRFYTDQKHLFKIDNYDGGNIREKETCQHKCEALLQHVTEK